MGDCFEPALHYPSHYYYFA